VKILFGTPNLLMIDLMNLTTDCLWILTTRVAFGHFVNFSMVMYRYRYPPMAMGNGPRMSCPHTVNNHEGGSFPASVLVCGFAWCETDTPYMYLLA
jgi:hypothetical protein